MRLLLLYALLLALQGFLGGLMGPLSTPDLFLLGVLTLLWRVPAPQLVAVGYGVGGLQDLLGYGALGVHALGLAGGVLLATFVRSQVSQAGVWERFFVLVAALLGKWLVLTALLFWMGGAAPFEEVLRVAPLEAAFTLLLGMWLLPFADLLRTRRAGLRREFR